MIFVCFCWFDMFLCVFVEFLLNLCVVFVFFMVFGIFMVTILSTANCFYVQYLISVLVM